MERVADLTFSPDSPPQAVAPGIVVKSVRYETALSPSNRFETHRNQVDIQVPVEGAERIAVVCASHLTPESGGWNAEEDVSFYEKPGANCPPPSMVSLAKGGALILFPDDAHLCGYPADSTPDPLKKFVFKVDRRLWAAT